MNIIKKTLHRYVYQDWNIAIADISDSLTPVNIKWMKHSYRDRWFADPFIIKETKDSFIILAEECLHETLKGRIARLTVDKDGFCLKKNETILDLPTHLSFPIPIIINGLTYIYPENAKSGHTKYYNYDSNLSECHVLSEEPLADPVIFKLADSYYLLATMGNNCNGDVLYIFKSSNPLGNYNKVQKFVFPDNTARRAGKIFERDRTIISPAQICNHDYGEGISLQEIIIDNGRLKFKEIKRIYPQSMDYPEGFHTYNVFGDKVVIDGYRYGSKLLHNLYFTLRKFI